LSIRLTQEEESMASGQYGPGLKKCITFLIKFGKALGADKLVKIASAHVFNAFPLELLADLSEGVNQTLTVTTMLIDIPLMDSFDRDIVKVIKTGDHVRVLGKKGRVKTTGPFFSTGKPVKCKSNIHAEIEVENGIRKASFNVRLQT